MSEQGLTGLSWGAPTRIPLNTLAIGFGMVGLAGTWSAAFRVFGIGGGADQWAWILATVVWVVLLCAHAVRGLRSADSFASQLRQPVQGPIAALIPIVTMLIGADVYQFLPVVGTIVVIASLLAAGLFAGWLLAHWVREGLPRDCRIRCNPRWPSCSLHQPSPVSPGSR